MAFCFPLTLELVADLAGVLALEDLLEVVALDVVAFLRGAGFEAGFSSSRSSESKDAVSAVEERHSVSEGSPMSRVHRIDVPLRFLPPELPPARTSNGTATSTCLRVDELADVALVPCIAISSSSSEGTAVVAGVINPEFSLLRGAGEARAGVAAVVEGDRGALTVERRGRVEGPMVLDEW